MKTTKLERTHKDLNGIYQLATQTLLITDLQPKFHLSPTTSLAPASHATTSQLIAKANHLGDHHMRY